MGPCGVRQQQARSAARCLLLFLVIAAIACALSTPCQAETTVSASLHPARFSVDRDAALTVTVNGSRSADIKLPAVAGLSFQGRGKSTQLQIVNGSFSSTVSFAYLVQAEHPGSYTIPPLGISVDGRTLTTQPISFEVIPAGSSASNPGGMGAASDRSGAGEAGTIAFLRTSELQAASWTGEAIPLRIKAYFRHGTKVSLSTLPVLKGDDLVMPPLDQKPRQTEETVNGTAYSVLTWESTLSAVKEGRHTLSFELEATLLLPQRRNPFSGFGDQDLFQDDAFQDFFGGVESKNIKVASPSTTLEAKQLPADHQPPGFSGAIGHFNLSVQATPTKVAAGDPITLAITIAGEGNFDRVEAPKFPEDPKWKTYPPSATFKQGDRPIQGKKNFEQAIVAKDDQVTAIPPLSFVYFDPTTEHYVTLASPPLPLSVQPGTPEDAALAKSAPAVPVTAAPVMPVPKGETKSQGIAGLAPIHLQTGRLQKERIPLYAKGWFAALAALCALVLLSALFWKARLRSLHNNPELLRNKEMQELLARHLAQIKEIVDKNDSSRYLAACRKALRELLGYRWQIEPSVITLADLQARLHPSSSLVAIFAAAEQGAYANLTLSAAQMRQYADQIEKELSELL